MRLIWPRHRYGPVPYILLETVAFGWAVGTNSTWWATNVQPFLESLLWPYAPIFLSGLLFQDLTNQRSWIREYWRYYTKKFEVTGLHTKQPADDPKRIEINVDIKFVRKIKSARLTLRVHSCTGLKFAPPFVHPIHIESLINLMKDETRRVRIAALIIPQAAKETFQSIWGNAPLSANSGPPALVGSSRNVVFLELSGPWMFSQVRKFFVENLDYGASPPIPGIYVLDEEDNVFDVSNGNFRFD